MYDLSSPGDADSRVVISITKITRAQYDAPVRVEVNRHSPSSVQTVIIERCRMFSSLLEINFAVGLSANASP